MKCVLPAINAKVFSKAIQSLAKIGSELFIEATSDYLSIRTLNSTKSAFVVFNFFSAFFTSYSLDQCADLNKCKVSLKASIGVFKNMKNVEHCEISINSDDSKLVVQLKCKLETVKTHSISIIDFETLQATYAKENVQNMILGTHKLYAEICNNFQMNEEEITFEADNGKLVVKNYVEGSNIDPRFMRSQLTLKADEFEKYSIKNETSITFCLKEFRAILNFAEALNLSLLAHFAIAGMPILFVLENLQTFEANLVMSTLSAEDFSMYQENTSHSILTNNTDQESSIRKRKEEKTQFQLKKARLETNSSEATNIKCNNIEPKSVEQVRENLNTELQLPSINLLSDTCNSSRNPEIDEENRTSSEVCVIFKDTEDHNSVPASPTNTAKKKKRVIFRRCFEATFNLQELCSSNEVLARNSDTEE